MTTHTLTLTLTLTPHVLPLAHFNKLPRELAPHVNLDAARATAAGFDARGICGAGPKSLPTVARIGRTLEPLPA